MKLSLENTFKHNISRAEFDALAPRLPEYLEKIKQRDVGFYNSFVSESEIAEIEKFAKAYRQKFSHFVVLGIGGSALGFEVLQNIFGQENFRVLKNIDPYLISQLEKDFPLDETCFIVISKSGGTIETLSQFFYFSERVPKENFVFISEEGTFLHQKSQEFDVPFFSMPVNVGGRFSVLTEVGLVPAALSGINIKDLISGAKKGAKDFLQPDCKNNSAFQIASAMFLAHENKQRTHVFWTYSEMLKGLGAWIEQLLAESTGKNGQGITPLTAMGATDHHSTLQNFAEGMNDKFYIFIKPATYLQNAKISCPEQFSYLQGRNFAEIFEAEFEGTRQSLAEKGRSSLTLEIEEITPYYIGEIFMLWEAVTAFLGEFMGINAYDQPGVERSKVVAREILSAN